MLSLNGTSSSCIHSLLPISIHLIVTVLVSFFSPVLRIDIDRASIRKIDGIFLPRVCDCIRAVISPVGKQIIVRFARKNIHFVCEGSHTLDVCLCRFIQTESTVGTVEPCGRNPPKIFRQKRSNPSCVLPYRPPSAP